MIPVNDGYWHHLGFTWSNRGGEWNVYIDGTHRCLKKLIKVGAIIPKGGTLVIGQKLTTLGFKPNKSFAGEISRLNLWDRALSGDEVEAMAKFPGNERGNLISWFKVVDNFVGDIKVIVPSKAQNTGKRRKIIFKGFLFCLPAFLSGGHSVCLIWSIGLVSIYIRQASHCICV